MKLLIASDLHGAAPAAATLKELFESHQPDRLVLLGDLLYHGPRNDLPPGYAPTEVIPILNSMKERITAVRGNCEAEVDQMVLEFPVLSETALLWPGGHTLFCTHGHTLGPDNPPPLARGDILLCGHTHVGVEEQRDGFVSLNPGSIGLPKDGHASYMVYENGRFTRFSLTGEVLGFHEI